MMIPPVGYRLLQIGEVIQEGDLYLSTCEKWLPVPVTGVPVIQNGVLFCRQRR